MKVVSFKNNLSGINNEIAVGNNGWLRDRFGIDVNVRIQSFTQYKDPTTTQTDTITFGNKIFGPDEWNNRDNAAKDAIHNNPHNTNIPFNNVLTITKEEADKIAQYIQQHSGQRSPGENN